MVINGLNVEPYKLHPRVVELRLVLMFDAIAREYDVNVAMDYFRLLCQAFRVNWTFISGILNKRYDILRGSNRRGPLFKQQVIFMGTVYGDSRYHISERFLNVTSGYMYRKQFSPNEFVTEEFLETLDEEVTLCGVKNYKDAALNFIDLVENLQKTFGYVSVSKSRL